MRTARPLQTGLTLLLAANTVWFMTFAPWTKGLDSLAWLALLLLFTLEAANPPWLEHRHARGLVHVLRAGAALGIAASAYGYLKQGEWLDALNIALWVLVVVLLEGELRWPQQVARHRRGFTRCAIALYASIAALIPFWALRGEWIDAYDAVLWLAAFALIELDLLNAARRA